MLKTLLNAINPSLTGIIMNQPKTRKKNPIIIKGNQLGSKTLHVRSTIITISKNQNNHPNCPKQKKIRKQATEFPSKKLQNETFETFYT